MTKFIPLSRAAAPVAAALGACLLASASPAAAFTPAPTAAKTGGENTPLNLDTPSSSSHVSSSGGASIVRTIVGLAIVIAVIWGLTWILKQVKASREGGRGTSAPSDGLASVAALTLGSGRSVHLVRAGSDYVLLGSTEHGVAPIHRYTEEQARDAGLLPDLSQTPEQPAARSRVATAAGHIIAGTGRLVSAGAGSSEGGIPGEALSGQRRVYAHSPAVGARPDPMRVSSHSSGLIDRLRELTVRR
jgi:flagellar protein FliO/FliZ